MTETVKEEVKLKKPSFVLQALKILGLDDILKLAEAVQHKHSALKKAAGEELIVWDDAPKKAATKVEEKGKVLSFKERMSLAPPPPEDPPTEENKAEEDPNNPHFVPSDMLLWQREMSKETSEVTSKAEAMKGYKKATEIYLVKTQSREGQEKIRFLSTQGVLINKKQA